jgi:hypothetical protein
MWSSVHNLQGPDGSHSSLRTIKRSGTGDSSGNVGSDVDLKFKDQSQTKSYRVLGIPGEILTHDPTGNSNLDSNASTKNVPNPAEVEKLIPLPKGSLFAPTMHKAQSLRTQTHNLPGKDHSTWLGIKEGTS